MVVNRGKNMNWYKGFTLYYYLNNLVISNDYNLIDFRFPVQLVARLNSDSRGYVGQISSGTIKKGERVVILPSGRETEIKSIIENKTNKDTAFAPQSVIFTLKDQVDISRGDMIVRQNNLAHQGDNLEAIIFWMGQEDFKEKNSYILQHTTNKTNCFINKLRYRLDVNNLQRDQKAKSLKLNEFARVNIQTSKDLMFDAYAKNKNTGHFILIDETSKNTVAAGIIVDKGKAKKEKNNVKNSLAPVLWFTGLSGAGKTSIAEKLSNYLEKKGLAIQILDGDLIRKNLNFDLGFDKESRDKNIDIAGFLSKILASKGIIVLASFISPYKQKRQELKKNIPNLVEIYVNASLEKCQQRDVKGLYEKVKAGKIKNFTGVNHPYEKPLHPDLELKTDQESLEESVDKVINYLEKKKWI